MSIATRRGDDGTTQMFFGPRLSKAAVQFEALGAVDELGAQLGVVRAFCDAPELCRRIEAVQRDLFAVGAELATPEEHKDKLGTRLTPAHVERLDREVAEMEGTPDMLADWALPGATQTGALLDVARTVCRRAERRVVPLLELDQDADAPVLRYLNRLSDVLWLYARWYEHQVGAEGALRPRPPAEDA